MKYQIVLLSLIVSLSGCVQRASNGNIQEEKPGTAVTLTHAAFGKIEKKIILSATTSYQNKSMISAPIPAFITEVLIQPGSRVKAGDILYRIESKEQHALGNSNHTVIPIKAERDGIVLDVQQQAGNYVTESNVLCSVAEVGSLVFEINVPYEQKRYARSGSRCMLELPDGTQLTATVYASLATMNTASQSERVIARAKVPFLPEGMNVKAVFTENGSSSDKGMILPKSAVQSDETLTQHWVMKLSDNGTAVRVPIEVGNSNASEIEIKSDVLSPQDRIILTGGYGLEDGAKVVVTKEEAAL
mgnify:FL=1